MKRLMAATLALTLLDATAALADDNHHDEHARPAAGAPAPAPGHANGGGHAGPAAAPAPAPHGGIDGRGDWGARPPEGQPAPPPRSGPYPYVQQGQADRPHPDEGRGGYGGPPATHQGRDFGAPGFQPGAQDRPRYNEQYFPHQIRPSQRYHWGGDHRWAGQPGFYYRRWGYGEFLPQGWFASPFWIYDWGDYDLPVPPYGYEWVRVGPDALLVDSYSGEVVSAVYGIFY